MTFKGVFPASEITPAPCGLLSVANIVKHTGFEYDERWVRKLSQEFNTLPTHLRLLTVNDETIASGELSDNSGELRFLDYQPFYIDIEDFSSTFGLLGVDRFQRILTELECATQKALEFEFWEGAAARAETSSQGNMYLKKENSSVIPVSGAKTPEKALMFLEQAISESPLGTNGIIHMTRDVASILGNRLVYVEGDDNYPSKVITRLGTKVVVGSGYIGNGPIGDGNAAASSTNKWIFATHQVEVHLGKIEVVNKNLAQGADVTINNMRIKAYRPAAVFSDPSILFAMRVTLPND